MPANGIIAPIGTAKSPTKIFRLSFNKPVPGLKTKIKSLDDEMFGKGSLLLLIIAEVNDVLKIFVAPPD